jgi:acetylglutamate kinase
LKLASKEDKKKKIDVGLVGEVVLSTRDHPPAGLRDFIPVIAPIGGDEKGVAYNINFDIAAGKLAVTLRGKKLDPLTTTGVLTAKAKFVTGLHLSQGERDDRDGTISGGAGVECALDAVRNGVKSAHIIDGRVSHALPLITGQLGRHVDPRRRREPRRPPLVAGQARDCGTWSDSSDHLAPEWRSTVSTLRSRT